MQLLLSHLLLSSLFTLSGASPIWRHITQQVLSALPRPSIRDRKQEQVLYKPSSYLDVRPNAVALALTSADDYENARYFFLPVGKNVQTHTTPELPLHPLTAHIIGAVSPEGFVVHPLDMEDMECAIYPSWNRTLNRDKSVEDFAIRISSRDGVVDFVEEQQPFWLGGREVEGYECW